MVRHPHRKLLGQLMVAVGALATSAGAQLPNVSYPADEVFTVIGRIDKDTGAPRAHGTVMMHQGYLVVVFSRDSGEGDGGFAFFDVSDPRAPVLVHAKDDDETEDIREAHGFGFARIKGRDYVVLQASLGVQFWDWTDVTEPKLVSYLKLPGITASDYGTGAWWTFWQGTHVFVGGSGNGLYVVDARDPANAFLVPPPEGAENPTPPGRLGTFKTGPVTALGNVLALFGMDQGGFAMVAVPDPARPQLLSARSIESEKIYSGIWVGDVLFGAGTAGNLITMDVSSTTKIVDSGKSVTFDGRGGYLSVQDGFAHVGGSKRYFKVDLTKPAPYPIVGSASSELAGRDEDFATVLGNLVFVSDDHGKGTSIVPHQAGPDLTPPAVLRVEPRAGALGQPLTSRVGLAFSDQIDFTSVDEATVILRKVGGPAVDGIRSYQSNIVSFAPLAPLEPNTTYELVLAKGGLRDVAGNAVDPGFVSLFSTGNAIDNPLCSIESTGPAPVGASVTFTAKTPATGNLAYEWELGGGKTGAGASVSHSYDAPAHVTVLVRIVQDGAILTACSLAHTAHRPLASGRPTRSGVLALDESGGALWVANPDSGSVSRLNLASGQLEREIPVGEEPRAVALAPDGRTWVVSERASTLSIVSGDAVVETIALGRGTRPAGLAFAPDGSAAYVTLYATGKLLELDPITGARRRSLDIGPLPRGLAVTADGAQVLVSRHVSPSGHAEVRVVSAVDFAVDRVEELEMDLGPDSEASGRGVLNYLRSPVISPDGTRAFLPAKKDNTERGFFQDGNPLDFESTVRATVAQLLLSGGEDLGLRVDLNDRNLPSDVALSPLGDLAFVATEGSNTVEVLDAYDGDLVTSIEGIGSAPDGVVLSTDGTTLYVHSFLSRSVSVLDVSAIVQGGANQATLLRQLQTVETEPLGAAVLRGKQIFYDSSDRRMARDKYLSCASCHLNGEQDGRVWDFWDRGEGLRNTISLLGKAGTGQGLLHWSANFDEVQDFEHDIRGAFDGTGFLSDADFALTADTLGASKAGKDEELDALALYVASLDRTYPSPHRQADGTATDAARAGRRLFEAFGCDGCHAGPRTTSSSLTLALHDVGTLGEGSGARLGEELTGLDVPSLQGLWTSAPYFHDGSAETLTEVLEHAARSERHGAVRLLTRKERAQLLAYLTSIDDDPIAGADDASCFCAVGPGRPSSSRPLWLGLALAALLGSRRRRSVRA
ncbi:MAG: Ig-like domain-containing protein [Polyangiaceae bacterium]|nr:Ig-like domain-containing protein [Polyangiaceae bacterium]